MSDPMKYGLPPLDTCRAGVLGASLSKCFETSYNDMATENVIRCCTHVAERLMLDSASANNNYAICGVVPFHERLQVVTGKPSDM